MIPADSNRPDLADAAESVEQAYRAEVGREVAQRVPVAVGVFLVAVTVSSAVEYVLQPQHVGPLLATYPLYLVMGLAYILAVQRFPAAAEMCTVVASNAAAVAVSGYAASVRGNGEMCVLTLVMLLTGLVVLCSLPLRGQAQSSVGALIGYPLALAAGVTTALPAAYSFFALFTTAAFAAVGAKLLDSYRFAVFRQGAQQAAMAQENARLMEEARAADRAKSDFLATLSHELRTPLSIIVGYADLLIDGAFPSLEEQTETLHRIGQQSQQLLDMIHSMLDLNRLEGGGISFVVETFAVSELFDNLRENLPPSWCKSSVHLDWRTADARLALHTDRGKVEIILRNLVHNALKYTQQGSVTISAARGAEADRVSFVVADTGEGIAADDVPHIFEMFRQGRGGPRGGGVGLGLYIVNRLSAALGGEIHVESQVGVGTRFVVSLPLQAPQVPGSLYLEHR